MFQKNLWKRAQKEIIQQALPDNWIRIHDRFTTYSEGIYCHFSFWIWVKFFFRQSNTKGKWPIIVPFEYKKDRACLIYEKARARRNGAKMTGAVKPYVCVLKLMHHQSNPNREMGHHWTDQGFFALYPIMYCILLPYGYRVKSLVVSFQITMATVHHKSCISMGRNFNNILKYNVLSSNFGGYLKLLKVI